MERKTACGPKKIILVNPKVMEHPGYGWVGREGRESKSMNKESFRWM